MSKSINTVYQPNQAHWPDALASFEAFTSIEEGRKYYPEVPVDCWDAMNESDIEDPTVIGETETMVESPRG